MKPVVNFTYINENDQKIICEIHVIPYIFSTSRCDPIVLVRGCLPQHSRTYIQAYEYKRAYTKLSGLSHNELYAYLWYYSLRSNKTGYGGKIPRLTHKIEIQLLLVTKSCTLCSSRSRRPVRKLTPWG